MQKWPIVALKPWLWRLSFFAVAVLLCLSLFRDDVRLSLFSNGTDKHSTCLLSRSLARSLHLTTPVFYTRLRIDVADAEKAHGPSTSDSGKRLEIDMPAMHRLRRKWNLDFVAADEQNCTTTATVELPRPPSTSANARNLVFGVSTPLHRLEESLPAFSHWAGNTGTTIYAFVNREHVADRDVARVTRKAADLGMTVDIARQNISSPDSSVGDRYFAMIKHVYERLNDPKSVQQGRTPQWAAFIDDDTFFPSMRALLGRLDAYDASQPHYIGGLSEDQVLLDLIGHMAYGGGGVFVSLPMLAQVYEHWDECNEHHTPGGGDKRLKECVLAHTTSKLEVEDGLHQVDIHGDVSGFYEAGRPLPLSIHHWKSWNHVDIVALAAVAGVCGDECLLSRYQTRDGWYLVNGYSIFRYSDWEEQDGQPKDAMEETWDGGDFLDRLGPLRPNDPEKESYRLVRSLTDGGKVRQFYVKRDTDSSGVIEVEWQRV